MSKKPSKLAIPMAKSSRLKIPRSFHKTALDAANNDPQISFLLSSVARGQQLAGEIRKLLLHHNFTDNVSDTVLCQVFISILCNFQKEGQLERRPADAIGKRQMQVYTARNEHHDFSRSLGLHWSRDQINEFYDTQVKLYTMTRLETPYPPENDYVCETQAVFNIWSKHLEDGELNHDNRVAPNGIKMLNRDKIRLQIKDEANAIVRDKDTGDIILIVLRNFCPEADILDWLEDVICETADRCRSIRLENPGILAIVGFSAGARSYPMFHWARNVTRKMDEKDKLDFHIRQSHAFAFFWNLMMHRVPQVILDDWKNWMEKDMLPAMNPLWKTHADNRGSYEVNCGNKSFTYNNVELAPPTGVMAQNYARAIHFEYQPHKYAAAWTVQRISKRNAGGNFYLSDYGIQVMSAPNTLVIWQPRHLHGTSLQNYRPKEVNPSYLQRGMAFVTSPRLVGVWQTYWEKLQAGKAQEDAKSEAEELLFTKKKGEDADEIFANLAARLSLY